MSPFFVLLITFKINFNLNCSFFWWCFFVGIFDEDGGYTPIHPDEVESEEEEEEEEEVDIQQQFTEVSEIRFPGEIGPLGDRRLCKIRCVKGKWVGPLCATNEEGKYKILVIPKTEKKNF